MDAADVRVVDGDGTFEVFEGAEVDGGVGEHADEAHGQATVEGAEAVGQQHFSRGGGDEEVAVEAAGDGFTLHAAGSGEDFVGCVRSGWGLDLQFQGV